MKANLSKLDENQITEDQRLELMADDIEQQIAKRGQFSRRRMFVEEKDVDYINDRNRKFNEKLERNYSKYASEIKANLERGTALWRKKFKMKIRKNNF